MKTAKLAAVEILESLKLQTQILELSRDSDTEFLGAAFSAKGNVKVSRMPLKLRRGFVGLDLGQSCINEKSLKIKLSNTLNTPVK